MGIEYLDGIVVAQKLWAAMPLRNRLAVMGRLRRRMAAGAKELAETIPTRLPGALHRTVADSVVAEVLPLIEACRFLEREAARILCVRNLGREGRPLWLGGLDAEVERIPWGVVLVLGAANYPLLLAGVQTLQALVAGNAVLWKPAPDAETAAFALRMLLVECGLPGELLTVLDADVEAAGRAIAEGVDYVVLTGSAETGKAVLRQLAETLTPATMELSGCDAVFVLPGAEVGHVVRALAFGMRFNGSFTCMAPRRVFLVGLDEMEAARFEGALATTLDWLVDVPIAKKTEILLRELIDNARLHGAQVLLNGVEESGTEGNVAVTLITGATPSLRAMRTDIFAPILSVMRAEDADEAVAADAACPYALTASIFGPEAQARRLARRLRVGNVLINDIVVPTADPRVAFGGRGRSGFGVTRGAEGLLAMTTPRTIQTIQSRRGKRMRVYEPTGDGHVELFTGLAQMLHGGGLRERWTGLVRMIRAGRRLR